MTRTMNQRLLSAMERRPNGDLEFSWKWARLNGQNILPEVRDQGNHPTCVFQAIHAAAEMKMMRNLANRDPPALSISVGTMASTHMVLVMGYGYRNGHPYLVFLNSNSKSFADEGFKRVYFDQIYTELFYTLNARAPNASVRTTHHNQNASASTSATTLQDKYSRQI
uniref:Peptidase C1A papain C-terminal domain-containing protein n=1 Tax=Oryza punctata TaxID=4537 RepID=A0A0E0LWE1_ORYPU